jgi:hypothetical protein
MNKYYQNDRKLQLSAEDAYNMLQNFDKNKHTWTNDISKPVGGEIYIFFSEDSKEYNDWKHDGVTWRNNGHRAIGKNSGCEMTKIHYVLEQEKTLIKEFIKHVYKIPDMLTPTLVHYIGDEIQTFESKI